MGRKWTPTQRLAKQAEQKLYWANHPHPRRNQTHRRESIEAMKKPKNRRPVGGTCIICGRALYDPVSIKRGMGAKCAGVD